MNDKYQEFMQSLIGKRIAVIGAGVSNLPLIKVLMKNKLDVTVMDKKSFEEMEEGTSKYLQDNKIKVSLGSDYLSNLKGFDVIFRSPSMLPTNPYLEAEAKNGCLITTEIEQVIKLAPCPIIGVTGSKGKTTTTTILYKMLEGMKKSVFVGGNIGTPLFDKLDEMKSSDLVVLELSSFQLMNMTVSPHVAVVTNISPDHLDVHGSYEEYIDAKKYIFKYQNKDDILVLNGDDEIVKGFSEEAKGVVRYFKNTSMAETKLKDFYVLDGDYIKYNEEEVIDTSKLMLRGKHNYLNMCAALNAIRDYIDVSNEELEKIASDIKGVAHRLEYVCEIDGVKWYNDSASTTPDKSMAGIYAFDEDVVLIAGGYDKNISYEPMAKPILDKVSKLILFGATRDKIYDAVMSECKKTGKSVPIYLMDTLEEVVSVAKEISVSGEVVLFSPASASFDMFKNAYQRGDLFKKQVIEIKRENS